jgi:hypothetical protein
MRNVKTFDTIDAHGSEEDRGTIDVTVCDNGDFIVGQGRTDNPWRDCVWVPRAKVAQFAAFMIATATEFDQSK